MASLSEIDENRRRFLLHLLASAAFTTTAGCSISSTGLTSELPAGRSIQALTGDVHVNGVPASVLTLINPGDIIETFDRSFVVFVVQKDAFILRSNSIMTLPGRTATPGIISTAFTLERGKALSVLASRRTDISTPNAVIGVRGTGVYVEAEPDLSYVCVCYGTSDVTTRDDPDITETIVSDHHTGRYILADKSASQRIIPAPFKNHDDQELLLIETLVGRTPPFIVPRGVTRTRGSYL